MVLRQDFSVVADSEMASSPPAEPSPQPIKRAARTYGRRRDDPDTLLTYSEPVSSDSIYRTGPPDVQDEVPPSEPSGLPETDNEEDDKDDEDVLPSLMSRHQFTFGWRDKMKQVDEDPSKFEGISYVDERASLEETSLPPVILNTDVDGDRTRPKAGPADVFGNPPSPASTHDNGHLGLPSPIFTLKPPRTRSQKNLTLYDNDTDDDTLGSRPSSPQTPLLHPIATPKSHFTSSPPTSYHDVSANSRDSSASKGKGKNHKRRHSVAPTQYSPHGHDSSGGFEDSALSPSRLRLRKKRIKAPTKKDRQEMIRERTRMAVEQEVSLERRAISERSLKTFFSKLGQQEGLQSVSEQPLGADQPEPLAGNDSELVQTLDVSKDDVTISNERLEVGAEDPVKNEERSADVADQKQKLSQLKRFWLSRKKELQEDGDLGLEVEGPTELERQRKSTGKKMSHGQQILLANAGLRSKPLRLDSQRVGREDIASVRKAILKQGTSDPHALNLLLRRQAEEESLGIVKQKEEEWKRLGGTLRDRQHAGTVVDAQRNQIQKGLTVWSERVVASRSVHEDRDGPEGDESDCSRESGSESGSEDDIDYEKMEMGGEDQEMVVEQDDDDDDDDDERSNVNQSEGENEDAPTLKARAKGRPRRRVVDSDESDSGGEVANNDQPSGTRSTHYITSSSDDRTEDENDKENNTRLMFDRSDDKENKAVARHVPFLSTSVRSVFDDVDRELSLSPPHVGLNKEIKSGPDSSTSASEEREPFGVLSEASPVSRRTQSSGLTQSFNIQLKHSSSPSRMSVDDGDGFDPAPSEPVASLAFAPVFGGESDGKGKKVALGFSQASQELDTKSFGAPSLLRPGLSDLFNSSTQRENASRELRKQESLGLTQDLMLQPALQVDDKLLRKADTIFEKEQESVVEAINKKDVKEQEVYVNDLGFLTQTRPSTSRLGTRSPSFVLSPTQPHSRQTPGGLRRTRTQSQSDIDRYSSDSPQVLFRPPLRTISLSNPQLSSPESSPKRLRKRSETPTIRESPTRNTVNTKSSPSPLRRHNAFDVLGKVPPKVKDKGKDRDGVIGKMVRKEWLAEEAEESDEDQAVGFGFIKRNGGEEDEEGDNVDLDATLTELVDDQKMDEDTVGADKVMEKHQELLEQDDEAAFKFHQGVVQGELRKKRKNRFGLEDSDDEEEEDDRARRIRRKMREKVERGDIQELAANAKTAAFASIYQSGLVDDEPIEVRPLEFDFDIRMGREPGGDDALEDEESEDRDASNSDEAGGDKNQYVTYSDIRAEVQKMKEQPEPEVDNRNYADVSWIDQRDEEMDLDPVNVHIVPSHVKMSATTASIAAKPVAEWDLVMKGGVRRRENEKDLERSRAWAKNETRNMTGSTGRVVGGIAVTGLGTRVKDGGGSLRSKASTASISGNHGGKKSLRAESSVLAGLAKRKEQFQ